jgi:hypothetical protein
VDDQVIGKEEMRLANKGIEFGMQNCCFATHKEYERGYLAFL